MFQTHALISFLLNGVNYLSSNHLSTEILSFGVLKFYPWGLNKTEANMLEFVTRKQK